MFSDAIPTVATNVYPSFSLHKPMTGQTCSFSLFFQFVFLSVSYLSSFILVCCFIISIHQDASMSPLLVDIRLNSSITALWFGVRAVLGSECVRCWGYRLDNFIMMPKTTCFWVCLTFENGGADDRELLSLHAEEVQAKSFYGARISQIKVTVFETLRAGWW